MNRHTRPLGPWVEQGGLSNYESLAFRAITEQMRAEHRAQQRRRRLRTRFVPALVALAALLILASLYAHYALGGK